MNPRSTDFEADALTTTPSRPLIGSFHQISRPVEIQLYHVVYFGVEKCCCNNCSVEKVYEQGPVPFFFHVSLGDLKPAKGPSDHTFVIRTIEIWLCDFFSSSFYPPPYFAHRFMNFPVTCDIYDRAVPFCVVYLCITAVIVYAFFFLLKLFALNKLFVCTFSFLV